MKDLRPHQATAFDAIRQRAARIVLSKGLGKTAAQPRALEDTVSDLKKRGDALSLEAAAKLELWKGVADSRQEQIDLERRIYRNAVTDLEKSN